MDQDEAGESGSAGKKRRGPYKQYLDVSKNLQVPRSTLFSRKKAMEAGNQNENERGGMTLDAAVGDDAPIVEMDIVELAAEGERDNQQVAEDASDEDFENNTRDDDILGGANEDIDDDRPGEADREDPRQKTVGDYIEKHKLNEKLHRDFQLSRLDCLLMILHLAIRHSHTQKFIEDQIQFVNYLFGSCVLDVSFFIFQKVFPSSKSIERHFFCADCEKYVGSQKDFPKEVMSTKCPKCDKDIDVHSVYSGNYFITLSIKEQIEDLLRPGIKLVEPGGRDQNIIADIFDGLHYKKCRQPGGPFDKRKVFTVSFNTDGVQMFDSNQDSLYPFFLHLNEIVPQQRFKTENLILGGLWFGEGAPNMALFLKPCLAQLMELSVVGVTFPEPDGTISQVPVFPLFCSVDSVAKPKIVCQHQFNGGLSCLYCYHPNDTIADLEKSHLKYFDTTTTYPLRQELEVVCDMNEADELGQRNELRNSTVNGFLGISVLTLFVKFYEMYPYNPFNIVWGVVIDYLHALLEGVASTLLGLYKGILTPAQLQVHNNRLDQIKLPQGMSRKPRRLDAKVKYKAKKYRSFFLYFAVPCFEDLLPARNFANLKLFVNALHIFLGDKILLRALNQAKIDMNNFVTSFQRLYGLQSVT